MAKKTDTSKPVKTKEQREAEKRASFMRVCEPRLKKAVKYIRLIIPLASVNYSSTPEQQKAVLLYLQTAVDAVKNAFEGGAKDEAEIKLPQ